ncbi:MAG: hypothetical protein ABSF53_03860 [Terracidiphilus sp.]|jgi:hypothetical protein
MQKTLRLALVACLMPAPMLLAQKELKGSFPFNETIHIVQQAATDGKCGTSLSGAVSSAIINDTGIWTFDGNGHMTIADHGAEITVNPPTDASQVVAEAAECKGSYSWLDKSTLDLHYRCSLDHFVSYFQVHSIGKVTPFNILVEVAANPDGTPGVSPYIYKGETVGCSNVLENTVVSLTGPPADND